MTFKMKLKREVFCNLHRFSKTMLTEAGSVKEVSDSNDEFGTFSDIHG